MDASVTITKTPDLSAVKQKLLKVCLLSFLLEISLVE